MGNYNRSKKSYNACALSNLFESYNLDDNIEGRILKQLKKVSEKSNESDQVYENTP